LKPYDDEENKIEEHLDELYGEDTTSEDVEGEGEEGGEGEQPRRSRKDDNDGKDDKDDAGFESDSMFNPKYPDELALPPGAIRLANGQIEYLDKKEKEKKKELKK